MYYIRGVKPSAKLIQQQLIREKKALDRATKPQENREKRETL